MAEQVNELETAILQRAERLAAEYRERAQRSRDNILREAHDKLHLREEREVLLAKARAERVHRRRVQASELKFHKEMDLLRWDLVESVLEQLTDKMKALAEDKEAYLPILATLLAEGVKQMREEHLIVEVNAQDLERLKPIWDEFSKPAATEKRLILSSTPIDTQGGLLIRSQDNRVRLDNTFEGRKERLSSQLHQIILQRLLPERRVHDTVGGEA